MTKLRAPLSIDAALARIAGQLPQGWAGIGEATGRAERTARNWGDPDTPEAVPMDLAIRLDLAFQAAGGQGAPIFETYALQLELAAATRFADRFALAKLAAETVRECGEANSALITASQPEANTSDHINALREIEEAIAALNQARAQLDQKPP